MLINVNESEYCKLNVECESDSELLQRKTNEVISNLKNVTVPGFRKGKATPEAIKFHYKKHIEDTVKRLLAEEAFHSTLFEQNVKALTPPSFNSVVLKDGKFHCSFSFYKKPDFELKEYKGFDIPLPQQDMDAETLVQKQLENLRYKAGDAVPFDENETVQLNDKIIMDYECHVDGKRVDELSALGEMLDVGSSPISAFDESLIGMKVGETKSFALSNVPNMKPEYDGKTLNFTLTLNMGSRVTPLALDDEMAVKLGLPDFKSLHEFISARATTQLENNKKAKIIQQISSRLLENHEFSVPEKMISLEAQYVAAASRVNWSDLTDQQRTELLSVGEKNVRLHLILDKIRDVEPETQLSDEEVLGILRENFKDRGDVDGALKELSANGRLHMLMERVRDEYVLEFVFKNSKIGE